MVRRLAERGVPTEAVEHPDLERMRTLDGWPEVEALVVRANSGPVAVEAPAPGPAPKAAPARAAAVPAAAAPAALPPTPGTAAATTTAAATPTPAPRSSLTIEPGTLTEDALRFSADRFTPSGLAYDAVSRRFVMGDELGRKLRVVGEGLDHAVDLVRAESAGFLDVRALVIDTRRGDLWVATSDTAGVTGSLHRIQLVSGRPLQSFPLAADTGRAIQPVDLAVAGSGVVFVLERDGRILRARPGATGLDTVITLEGIDDAASLALAAEDTTAYVAHAAGVVRVDLSTGATAPVTSAAELPLTGVERLRAHRAGFVALQRTADGERRLLRLELSRNGRAVRSATTYDVRVEAGSAPALTVSGDEVAIVSGATGAAETTAAPSALGPPAELVVRRFRLR